MAYLFKLSVILFCLLPVVKAQEQGPALSTIHSEQLIRIMQRLNELAYEREYTELGLDRLRAEQIDALVLETDMLSSKADNLPSIITEGELTTAEQITFKAVASQLHAEVLRIQADIQENNFINVDAGYRRIRQTCESCHNLFRDK